jgi:hypothetical protein
MEHTNWANFSTLIPTVKVNRFEDKKGNRFYWFIDANGEIQISIGVTSAFGEVSTETFFIDRWKENNDNWKDLLRWSSDYGTMLHICYENVMLVKPNDDLIEPMTQIVEKAGENRDMPVKDILSFVKFRKDYDLTPKIVEGKVAWQDPKGNYLMMTIDLLAEITVIEKTKFEVEEGVWQRGERKGQPKMVEKTEEREVKKIVLIDFKSNFFGKDRKSFFEAHLMQLIAAKKAIEQQFDIKVDEIYNFAPNNWLAEPTYTLKKWEITTHDLEVFEAYWNLITVKGINNPTGKILKIFDINDPAGFKYYSYREYIQEFILNDVVQHVE